MGISFTDKYHNHYVSLKIFSISVRLAVILVCIRPKDSFFIVKTPPL